MLEFRLFLSANERSVTEGCIQSRKKIIQYTNTLTSLSANFTSANDITALIVTVA